VARQESARRAALLNGGSGVEAFSQLQQLQAAYSQAAASGGLGSTLKEANSKSSSNSNSSKAPSNNNYSYYQANSAQASTPSNNSSGKFLRIQYFFSGTSCTVPYGSAQCCGSGMFIRDPNFFHPGSRVKKIPDPGSVSKNLSIFTQKIVSRL
jgi:hypothetical protein